MARYRKVENCGRVPYPDHSGRFLHDGETVEDDEKNDWAPLVALGYIVEMASPEVPEEDKVVTPAEEPLEEGTPVEAAEEHVEAPLEVSVEKDAEKAAEPEAPPLELEQPTEMEVAIEAELVEKTAPKKKSTPKKRVRKRKKKTAEVKDVMQSADDGAGAEEVDSSATRESDS